MAYRNLAIPWLSGGAILLGYAAYAWARSHQLGKSRFAAVADGEFAKQDDAVEPLSQRLERVPEELVLDLEDDFAPSPQSGVSAPRSSLGALFLSRATEALSPPAFAAESELEFPRRSSAQ